MTNMKTFKSFVVIIVTIVGGGVRSNSLRIEIHVDFFVNMVFLFRSLGLELKKKLFLVSKKLTKSLTWGCRWAQIAREESWYVRIQSLW